MTCAVVFGVCFVIVPSAHIFAYGIHRCKSHLLRYSYAKLYSSDETLNSCERSEKYDGFSNSKLAGQPIVTYESDVFDTQTKGGRHKNIQSIQKESKRTRRRTNSGCYSKLDNLPDSDM